MIEIKAPTESSFKDGIFLAGGITGCPDWQSRIVAALTDYPGVLFNPRRDNFPINDPAAARAQIAWEYWYLRRAKAISFWFPMETLCPIVLYELGAHSMTEKKLFIGVHSQYERKQDVRIQTGLVRPEIEIVYSLNDLAEQIGDWADENLKR